MSEGAGPNGQSYWRRSDDRTDTRVLFHDYCSIDPVGYVRSVWRALAGSDPDRLRDSRAAVQGPREPSPTRVQILPRADRRSLAARSWRVLYVNLQFSPLVVLLVALVLFGYAEWTDSLSGLLALLPDPANGLLLAALPLWAMAIGYLVVTVVEADVDEPRDALDLELLRKAVKPTVVYGGLLLLIALTAFSVYLVASGAHHDEVAAQDNIVYVAGFLLLLYVGGPLVYDGVRRTETLFSNLDAADIVESTATTAAESADGGEPADVAFTRRLNGSLGKHIGWLERSTGLALPTAFVAGALFVGLWALLWWRASGPFNLGASLTFVVAIGIDLVISVVAVQFIVLVKYLNDLYEGRHFAADLDIVYDPTHPDDAGGLRDFGRFITRVNTLLILSASYLSYRLFVQGFRDPVLLGHGAGSGLSTRSLEIALTSSSWLVSYLLPVLAFGAVLAAWIYFSFWTLHLKMAEKRFEQLQELRRTRPGRPPELEQLRIYREAPVWPINSKLLLTLVSLDVISLLIALPTLVF